MTLERLRTFFRLEGDRTIWNIVLALLAIGLIVVFSARGTYQFHDLPDTGSFLFKHIRDLTFCLFIIIVCHRLPFKSYASLSRYLLMLSVLLLILVQVLGVESGGAKRALPIPFFSGFMPSDLAKFALIANLAAMLAKRLKANYSDPLVFVPPIFWCGFLGFLLALNSGSAALLLMAPCWLLMFIGQVPIRYLVYLTLAGSLAFAIAYAFGSRGTTWEGRFSRPTNVISQVIQKVRPPERLTPEDRRIDSQEEYSLVAVASGDWIGRGPGNSLQRNFMTQAYSDFAYAILIEEWGFVGGVFTLVLYLWLLYRSVRFVAFRRLKKAEIQSGQAFGYFLAAGLAFSLVLQALVHMAVSVQLIPVTGQTLPLISWGGSSLLFTGVSIGAILSVSREAAETQPAEPREEAAMAA
ncbi:cell division protein FtsW [Siphonobacter sp. BAB-5385]|uniref:FtsW/RodA/SpoVE family cell cycle protein n=1 Tax=unclassified Siphonobacter TaxID=2635712 RepID=UPI000B9E8BD7|nr:MULTISPECIES: FtsW/RodA/SpoVE family cell cycle protein [unclassified Siphonobacter]OZI05557.1 cell division protein FtsW [Siphonobacter sp. BAB-5385]PMD95889.1 cell division protein FtsW [Siphonobacter sp. BAB-5405]